MELVHGKRFTVAVFRHAVVFALALASSLGPGSFLGCDARAVLMALLLVAGAGMHVCLLLMRVRFLNAARGAGQLALAGLALLDASFIAKSPRTATAAEWLLTVLMVANGVSGVVGVATMLATRLRWRRALHRLAADLTAEDAQALLQGPPDDGAAPEAAVPNADGRDASQPPLLKVPDRSGDAHQQPNARRRNPLGN